MTQLDKLETSLDEVFVKKVPFKIPEDGRKALAGALWWLALVFGVLELWGTWALWHVAHLVEFSRAADYANSLAAAYGIEPVGQHIGFLYYVALLVIAGAAVFALLAAPGLKAMKKSGWNFLFYSMLINVVYGVVVLFADYGGISYTLPAFVGAIIGAYLLFQVRGEFIKSHAKAKKA